MTITLAACRGLSLAIALAVVVFPASPAKSQETAVTLPSPLTPEAIHALVSRLSDREVRDLLLQELASRSETAPAGTAEPEKPIIASMSQSLGNASRQIAQSMARSPDNAAAMVAALGSYFGSLGREGTLRLVLALAVALGIGLAIDWLYARWKTARIPAAARSPHDPRVSGASLHFLARRMVHDAGGAIMALIAAVIVLGLSLPDREAQVGTTFIVWMVFFPWFAWIVLRFFLSPARPELRLVTTDDWTARVLMWNLVGLTIAVGLIETLLHVAREIGAGQAAQHVGFWINAMIFLWLAAIIVICRRGLRNIVRGQSEQLSKGEEWVVAAYPGYGVVVIALTWFAAATAISIGKEEVVRQGHHFLSLCLLLLAPMCDTIIRSTVHRLVPPMRGSGPAAIEAYESAWRSYVRMARVFVFGAIIATLAWLWDVSLVGGGRDNEAGQFAAGLLILAVGFVAREIASLVINRKLANETSSPPADDGHEADEGPVGGVASRLTTILPPISWALQAAIIVLTVLTALDHVGVNVTALVAGAGVVGIAVGFGAQKLVADVVSGLFFLIDDAFRLNEYIDVGGVQGSVEKIALRSILLRQSDGAIQCVPYSNISAVSNLGRDWGTRKCTFTVPFDTDIEKVRKIFKKIGQDLYDDPAFTDAFIQPFKYKGVGQVNDVGIVVRGKFMFRPELGKQFPIQREIYRRVHADFAAAGIQFARREVRVSVDTQGAPLSEEEKQSILTQAAASEATTIAVAEAEAAASPKQAKN
jgi:small-conductance mechanosensitive channel